MCVCACMRACVCLCVTVILNNAFQCMWLFNVQVVVLGLTIFAFQTKVTLFMVTLHNYGYS